MKMKRFLSVALALTMILSMLAACGGGGEASPDQASDPSTGSSAPEESKEPAEESGVITLGIWPEDTETEAILPFV